MNIEEQAINKRKFNRTKVQLLIDYSDGIHFYSDIIKDISIGGLRIESLRGLEIGKQLILTLPAVPPIKVKGEVMWSKKQGLRYQIGIKFIGLKQEHDWQIQEIIRAHTIENLIIR